MPDVIDVAIFGTGSCAERAWQAASAVDGVHVACFVDNDPGKQIGRFHGRAVLSPAALAAAPPEFVVIASVYRREIEQQLLALGVPDGAVVAANPNEFGATFRALAAGGCQPAVGDTGAPGRKEGLVRLAGSERLRSLPLAALLADRVHYACGRNVLAGWLNLDGYDESFPSGSVPQEIAERIYRLDLTGPHPFPDNYFRLGYSEDFVEHIEQHEFVAFLCECYRTFRPGGVLRLSSPGLEGVLRRHLRGSDWAAADVMRDEAYTRWWHKHFLCFAEVDAIARHIGWSDVRQCAYGESTIADLRQDTRESQADLNLVVELVK